MKRDNNDSDANSDNDNDRDKTIVHGIILNCTLLNCVVILYPSLPQIRNVCSPCLKIRVNSKNSDSLSNTLPLSTDRLKY